MDSTEELIRPVALSMPPYLPPLLDRLGINAALAERLLIRASASSLERKEFPPPEQYDGWLNPNYVVVPISSQSVSAIGEMALPSGIEAIACFYKPNGNSAKLHLELLVSENSLRKRGVKRQLANVGFQPNLPGEKTLEEELVRCDERTLWYADATRGVKNIVNKGSYRELLFCDAEDFITAAVRRIIGDPTLRLSPLQTEKFRRVLEREKPKPFHFDNRPFYTTYQRPFIEEQLREQYTHQQRA